MKNALYISFGILSLFLTTSCVSKKVYEELEDKYNRLLHSNSELIQDNEKLVAQKNVLTAEINSLKDSIRLLQNKKTLLEQEYTSTKSRLDKLVQSYQALQDKSDEELAARGREISQLLDSLQDREDQLEQERLRLERLQAELSERSRTVDELQALIRAREEQVTRLRHAVEDALQAFEGKGLHVYRKNGKVYVSMENKLLFSSGSWAVENRGMTAVHQLAGVLKKNPDIEILIEGHTDNVPYRHSVLADNWDLSVKRATSIVRILQSDGVSPRQIIAAGRGEYVPVRDNATPEGRAANRRIEIILSPNLDKINHILNGDE